MRACVCVCVCVCVCAVFKLMLAFSHSNYRFTCKLLSLIIIGLGDWLVAMLLCKSFQSFVIFFKKF